MLRKGIESPWRKREMRRLKESSYNNKAIEDAAFPGVSLKKKQFSVKKAVPETRTGTSAQHAPSKQALAKFDSAKEPALSTDDHQMVEKGKAEQKQECYETDTGAKGNGRQGEESLKPRRAPPSSSTVPTADLPDPSRVTELKRKKVPDKAAELPPSLSSDQCATSDIQDVAKRAAVVNVGKVRDSSQLVKSYNSPVVEAKNQEQPSDVEELVGKIEELGILSNLPQWKTGERKGYGQSK